LRNTWSMSTACGSNPSSLASGKRPFLDGAIPSGQKLVESKIFAKKAGGSRYVGDVDQAGDGSTCTPMVVSNWPDPFTPDQIIRLTLVE